MKHTILQSLRLAALAAVAFLSGLSLRAETPTLYLSNIYTTHIRFATAVSYVDLSNPQGVAAKVVDSDRNVIALKARAVLANPCSVTVIESNGQIHTFLVVYRESPEVLVYDANKDFNAAGKVQEAPAAAADKARGISGPNNGAGPSYGVVAPTLESVLAEPQHIFHIGDTQYGVRVLCENILVHNDVFYLVLSLENNSGISYTPATSSFNVQPRKVLKHGLDYTDPVTPRSSYGTLFAMPGSSSRAVYCFDKVTLLSSQVFKIYVSEAQGQRNFVLTLTADDINRARVAEGGSAGARAEAKTFEKVDKEKVDKEKAVKDDGPAVTKVVKVKEVQPQQAAVTKVNEAKAEPSGDAMHTPQYVSIDWARLDYRFDHASGELYILKGDGVPVLAKGNSFVLPKDKYECNPIRVVDRVVDKGQLYVVYTTEGFLKDVFTNLTAGVGEVTTKGKKK